MEGGMIIDAQDAWLLEEHTCSVRPNGYVLVKAKFNGQWHTMYLHHCIMGSPIWEGEEIDHINGNRQDNRRSNLRYVTHRQNILNREQLTEEAAQHLNGLVKEWLSDLT